MHSSKAFFVLLIVGAAAALVHRPGSGQELKPLTGQLTKEVAKQIHKVKLEEGKEYLINMTGKQFDTHLELLDSDGKSLDMNDDGGYGLNARLGFVADKTAEYQIVATSFQRRGHGKYEVTISVITREGDADVVSGQIDDKSKKYTGVPYSGIKRTWKKDKIYKIDLESKDFDPWMVVRKVGTGNHAADQDGGPGENARLYFIPQADGEFEIMCGTKNKKLGAFTLTIQEYDTANE